MLKENYITTLWGSYSDNNNNEIKKKADSGLLLIPHLDLDSNMLKENGIIELFSALHFNTTLLYLSVSFNDVCNNGAVAISECLKSNSTLLELNMSRCKLFDEGAIAISNSLKTNCALKVLNISGNDISDEGAFKIAEAIKLNVTLSTLNVSKNWIHKEGIMAILTANAVTRALHKLECVHNTLGRSDFIAITDYVRANKSTVELNISYNEVPHCYLSFNAIDTVLCCKEDDLKRCMLPPGQYITPKTDPKYIDDIITCCIKDKYAEQLIVTKPMYYPFCYQFDRLSLISKAIKENKSFALKKLHIEQMDLNKEGRAIINCFNAEFLQEIKIWNSKMSSTALTEMLHAIECNLVFYKLDFSNCVLQDDDTRTIGMILKSSKSIQELILTQSRVSDVGAQILAEAVEVNATLLLLDVFGNPISDVGALAISKCLRHNKHLQCLNLSNTNISSKGIGYLAESVRMNNTLLRIGLVQNMYSVCGNLTDDTLQAIIKCLETNNTLQQINIPWNMLNMLNSDSIRKYLKAVETSRALQKFNISMLQLSYDNAIAIGNCLQHNKSISELKLSSLFLTPEEEEFVMNYSKALKEILELWWHAINNSCILPWDCDVLESILYLHCQEVAIRTIWDKLVHNISSSLYEVTTATATNLINNKLKSLNPHHYFDDLFFIESVGQTIQALILSSRLKLIADGIRVNTSLQHLEISSVIIQNEGSAIISDYIMHHKSIKELRLINANLDNEGAVRLFNSVQLNEVLQKIDVSHNDISDDGALAIAVYLRTNTTLQYLNISFNKICNNGIASISSCLEVNFTLKEICLSSDNISDEVASRLTAALRINSTLCTLIIINCSESSYSFSKILLSAMHYNYTIKTVTLPCVQKHEELCILKNCVENINLNRRNYENDVLIINFKRSSEYIADMYDYCRL